MNEKEIADHVYEYYYNKLRPLPFRDGSVNLHKVTKDYCYGHIDGWIQELYSLKKLSPTAIAERIKFYEQVKKEVEIL